jgi:hypothetical protein
MTGMRRAIELAGMEVNSRVTSGPGITDLQVGYARSTGWLTSAELHEIVRNEVADKARLLVLQGACAEHPSVVRANLH